MATTTDDFFDEDDDDDEEDIGGSSTAAGTGASNADKEMTLHEARAKAKLEVDTYLMEKVVRG